MTDRELDALVAEHVMGMKRHEHGEFPYACVSYIHPIGTWLRFSGAPRGCGDQIDPPTRLPSYSTTGDGMLAVIEAMQAKDWLVSVTKRLCGRVVDEEQMQFAAEFRQCVEPWGEVETYDPSAPRAVAIAALRALGVKVDP